MRSHHIVKGSIALLVLAMYGCGGGGSDTPANIAPVADAGPDQTIELSFPDKGTITLIGTSSDTNGAVVSHRWAQIGGTAVTLSDAATSTTTFTVEAKTQAYSFRYTVTDNDGAQQSDTVSVFVSKILFSDSFSNDLNWIFVNDTANPMNWSANRGELIQENTVFKDAFQESYHLGTYAYLKNSVFPGRPSFRFSVDVIPQINDDGGREGNDVGIMFPYGSANNYYRLSMSSRNGYTRLEKRENGLFKTVGVNSIGYVNDPPLPINMTVEINDDTIIVLIDDDPIFGVVDTNIPAGTVALYCQDQTSFDNVLITENSPQPMVAVAYPLAYSIALTRGEGNTLSMQAVALNEPVGSRVVYTLDDSTQAGSTELGGLYAAQLFASDGDHEITAILLDADGAELSRDINAVVGVGGDYIVTVGDSITVGTGDGNPLNNFSLDGRIVSRQGFQANLSDLISTSSLPQIVFNEGTGGDKSIDIDTQRIDSILERHPGANEMLLLIGTNDALSGRSDADFDVNLRNIVNTARTDVDRVYIARIPPVNTANPDAANTRIMNYNAKITAFVNGDPFKNINIFLGPDFYARFLNKFDTLYADDKHPNDNGYQVMADEWFTVLTHP
jgi:lysophospholipase L1-like esterase